jgi:hypothetical protein
MVYNKDINEISTKHLKSVWKKHFRDKPMPEVKAFNVSDEGFSQARQKFSHPRNNEAEVNEWGKVTSEDNTVAFVTKVLGSNDNMKTKKEWYFIFRRVNSPYTETSDLVHELGHIYKGEVGKLGYVEVQR